MSAMKPTKSNSGGTVQIVDSTNFEVSKTVAAALVTVKPGGMREMHWHPNADEWQYYVKGTGRMTVFDAGPNAVTGDFRPGDIGYIKKSLGHYIENTGTNDLVFLEIFKTDKYEEVSLTNWLAHSPKAQVAATLNMDPNVVARFAKNVQDIVPV
jgi:oxalate decarboxylase